MDRTTAEKLEKILRDVSAELDKSVRIMQDNSSEEDFVRYRRLIGKLLGEIFVEVLQPIYSEHPDLTPDGLKWPG